MVINCQYKFFFPDPLDLVTSNVVIGGSLVRQVLTTDSIAPTGNLTVASFSRICEMHKNKLVVLYIRQICMRRIKLEREDWKMWLACNNVLFHHPESHRDLATELL